MGFSNRLKTASLALFVVTALSFASFGQEPNPAACKINNENWCGTGSLCGYAEDGSGAYVLTNAHVATTRIGDKMSLKFSLSGNSERAYTGETLIAGYSNRDAVDWAIVFVPGMTADSGITPLKLLKTDPQGTAFTFTGSPRCIWPQSTIAVRLVSSGVPGVVMWQPPTIGGQSGSSLWSEIDGTRVSQILLTWIWGGNGAGQPTQLIWNNIQGKNCNGSPRQDGLELPPFGADQPRAVQDRLCEEGYHEAPLLGRGGLRRAVQDLPIWYVAGVEPPPDDDITPAELAAIKDAKAVGLDIVAVLDFHVSLMAVKTLTPNEPEIGEINFQPFIKPFAAWTPPPKDSTGKWNENQIHDGRKLTKVCLADGTCIFEWQLIK